MSPPSFKSLADALSRSPEWTAIDSAWRDSESLMAALAEQLPASLMAQVLQVRRGDPAKGIRGSQITVVARHASAAAKLRLALADWETHLRSAGWGIQHVRITAQPTQFLASNDKPKVTRAPIPASVKAAMGLLAQDMPNEALRQALAKISRRTV
jgi:hypothetical protein